MINGAIGALISRSVSESKGLNQNGGHHHQSMMSYYHQSQFPVKMVEKTKQQAPIAQSEPSDTDLDSSTSSTSAIETGTTQIGSGTRTPQRAESAETGPLERRSFGNLFSQIRQKQSTNSDEAAAVLRGKFSFHYFFKIKYLRTSTKRRVFEFHFQIPYTW